MITIRHRDDPPRDPARPRFLPKRAKPYRNGLHPLATAVLALLEQRAAVGAARPSIAEMQRRWGRSHQAVRDALSRLSALGHIRVLPNGAVEVKATGARTAPPDAARSVRGYLRWQILNLLRERAAAGLAAPRFAEMAEELNRSIGGVHLVAQCLEREGIVRIVDLGQRAYRLVLVQGVAAPDLPNPRDDAIQADQAERAFLRAENARLRQRVVDLGRRLAGLEKRPQLPSGAKQIESIPQVPANVSSQPPGSAIALAIVARGTAVASTGKGCFRKSRAG